MQGITRLLLSDNKVWVFFIKSFSDFIFVMCEKLGVKIRFCKVLQHKPNGFSIPKPAVKALMSQPDAEGIDPQKLFGVFIPHKMHALRSV